VPSVNPPADREQADTDPDLVLIHESDVARIGARVQCDTLPRPCAFRYAILRTGDGRMFSGYLWEDG